MKLHRSVLSVEHNTLIMANITGSHCMVTYFCEVQSASSEGRSTVIFPGYEVLLHFMED